jgi:hypothetical protein
MKLFDIITLLEHDQEEYNRLWDKVHSHNVRGNLTDKEAERFFNSGIGASNIKDKYKKEAKKFKKISLKDFIKSHGRQSSKQ